MFRILTLLFTICSTAFLLNGQIVLQGQSIICIGDLATFSFTVPSGKTASTYDWNFGDTYTSTKASPSHLYKKDGNYTVKLAVKYASGNQETFTLDVTVRPLPNAQFVLDASTDTCEFTNKVCLKDLSTQANANQPLVSRTYFWGDGQFNTKKNPKLNDVECHTYKTTTTYFIEQEVVDKLGCKSTYSRNVTIVPGVEATIGMTVTYPDCKSAVVCFTNQSKYTTSQAITYNWSSGSKTSSKPHNSNDPWCLTLNSKSSITTSLVATTKGGCTDSDSRSFSFEVPSSNRKIDITPKQICYGGGYFKASIDAVSGESVSWYLNGTKYSTRPTWIYNLKSGGIAPGKYKVKCIVVRGGCKQEFEEDIEILGPIANFKLYHIEQCFIQRKIFFLDKSSFVDTLNSVFKWEVSDPDGDKCTIIREKNINKYKNCNTTIGHYGKHEFTTPSSDYTVKFTVTDTVTGCSDEVVKRVDLLKCGDIDLEDTVYLCQNEPFLAGDFDSLNPVSFTLDSGKTWLPYGSSVGTQYAGWYTVGLSFKRVEREWAEDFGDDSLRTHDTTKVFYDTVYVKNYLYVKRIIQDDISFQFSKDCKPREGIIKLKNGRFKANETLIISWGDGERTLKEFKTQTQINELRHIYNISGASADVTVTLISNEGCETVESFPFSFGFKASLTAQSSPCLHSKACISAEVKQIDGTAWSNSNNLGTVEWRVNNQLLDNNVFSKCYQYDTAGKYTFSFIATSKEGCTDTAFFTEVVYEVVAGIKQESMGFYCDGQRTFIDSSFIQDVDTHSFEISKYFWDFGTGLFTSNDTNPTLAFDAVKKVYHIRHAVISNDGCRDTVSFDLKILKSNPLFKLSDSLGCSPLEVTFTNQTTGATRYIWELGDTNNITLETYTLDQQVYTYHKPGSYFVRLIGIDSFYNTRKGIIETCNTVYPKLTEPGKKITVLPSFHEGITGPTKLCPNEIGIFKSLSHESFDSEIWDMDDEEPLVETTNGRLEYSFKTGGTYRIKMTPTFQGYKVSPMCFEDFEMVVNVTELNADFSIDDVDLPIYQFDNLSTPINADFSWNFGHPVSGDLNASKEFSPSHDYGRDTGTYTICLIAKNENCIDTACKLLICGPQSILDLSNVFTPGNDGLNDEFFIDLDGHQYHDFQIFNRWGEVVYQSIKNEQQDEPINWNGRVNNTGKECPSGTYFYVIKYAFLADPHNHRKTEGVVTLIRD